MEEMAGIVPHKTILVNSLAVAADLAFGFYDLVVVSGRRSIAQARDTGTND
jgi:hypothetical protein